MKYSKNPHFYLKYGVLKGYGDSGGNRTRDTAVKGRCLDLLTTEPCLTLKGGAVGDCFLKPISRQLFINGSGSRIRTYDQSGMNRVL